ncbi:MAG: zinc dependent phospholipase C family protein [Eubacteriales bacterium]|nr:zinc dependent phospholipase C family protein [Eubacteriales bacterium]
MPDIYTHERFAKAARAALPPSLSPHAAQCPYAYLLGANGPDPLFYHRIWKGGSRRRLLQLAIRLHREKTAELLWALTTQARTPAQVAYACGFLCHYALDSSVHPYVYAQTAPGGLYDMPGGHGLLEGAIDGALCLADHPDAASAAIAPGALSPALLPREELRQISELLSACLGQVFGVRVPARCIGQSVRDMDRIARFLYRPRRARRRFLAVLEHLLKLPGQITGHIAPETLPTEDFLNESHAAWVAPDSPGQVRHESVAELTEQALARLRGFFAAAAAARSGQMDAAHFGDALGRCSYSSDVPDSGR